MIARIRSQIKKLFHWYRFNAFILYIIMILVLVNLIAGTDRGLQVYNLRLIVLLASVFSLFLSLIKQIKPLRLGLTVLLTGTAAVFIVIGNLAKLFASFLDAASNYFSSYWHALFDQTLIIPDTALLQEKWIVQVQAVQVLSERLRDWISALPTPAYDPVSLNLIWGIGLWMISFWIYWFVIKKKQVLVGFVPSLLVIGIIFQTDDIGLFALFWVLGTGILLKILANNAVNEDYWEQHRFSFSSVIRKQTIQNAVSISLLVVVSTGIITSPRLDEWIDDLKERRQSSGDDSSSSNPPADYEMPSNESGPFDIMGEAAFGRLPNTHLIGSGPELMDEEVMYVHIDDPDPQASVYYLRSATYDTYTVNGWLTIDRGFILHQPDEVAAVNYSANEKLIYQDVTLLEGREQGNLMPTVGELVAANVPYFASYHTKFIDQTYTDLFATVTQETEYAAYSVVPSFGAEELRQTSQEYPSWIANKYLQIPDEVPDPVYALSLRLTATLPTPYDRALAIEQYLRRFEYSLELEPPPYYEDVVNYFLFESQIGYCDYFATSMVVLTRAAGIPARMVTGYLASTYDPERDLYIVTGDQAHSWAEVYFTGFGWVAFEPTSGRPAVERLEQREIPPDELVSQIEFESPDENFIETVSHFIPNNLYIFGSQVLLFSALVIVASHHLDLWVLRSMKPYRMFSRLYHRLRKTAKHLRVKISDTDTPSEFSELFAARLTKLGSDGLGARILKPTPQSVATILAVYTQTAYDQTLPEREEIHTVISTWGKLRWRFLLARLLLRLRPVRKGFRVFLRRIQ